MVKINSKSILLSSAISLSIAGAAWAGYSRYKRSQLRNTYQTLCSNTVIQWAKSFGNLENQEITFGPQQKKMMEELNAYTREYIDSGVDRLKKIQIQWTESYVPGYMKACVSYNLEEAANCYKLPQEQFMECAKSADETYQSMIQARLLEASAIDKKPWDLATTNLEVMRRSLRRMLAGELVPAALDAMSGQNSLPTENAYAQVKELTDSWTPLLSAIRELKKVVSENPINLKNADEPALNKLAESIDTLMKNLPNKLEELKPQLVNLRKSVLAKNPDLVIQYCDYFEEQHKRNAESGK